MKKTYFTLGSLATLALLVVGVASVSAFNKNENAGSDSLKKGQRQGQGHGFNAEFKEKMDAQRAEMNALLEKGDYSAWKEYMTAKEKEVGHAPKMSEVITEDNFAKFVEMHNLMQSGDREGSRAIATELGIEKQGRGKGAFGGKRGMHDRKFVDNNGDGVCDRLDVEEVQE